MSGVGRPAAMRALVVLALVLLAGCVTPSPSISPASVTGIIAGAPAVFGKAQIIDTVRAGGEPAVVVTPKGTILVATHPGYTHFTDPDPDLVLENSAQTYMWRSTDQGKTWSYVGLPMVNAGPRNAVPSISDPDFSVAKDGTIYYSDLWLVDLSAQMSTDDGQTWLPGQPVVAHQPTSDDPLNGNQGTEDRNWIAAGNASGEVYLAWQGDKGVVVGRSTDGGMTWPQQTALGIDYCILGKLRFDPTTNTVLEPLATKDGVLIAASHDQGKTFTKLFAHNATAGQNAGGCPDANLFPTLDVDKAGNYYVVWSEGAEGMRVGLSVSQDHGVTWSPPTWVSGANETALFPWVVAGDAGRVSVLWLSTAGKTKPDAATGDWFVHDAVSLDFGATFAQGLVSEKPSHHGNICTGGVGCVTARGDRRLGDYFTATIDLKGHLVVAYADTMAGGGLSHPSVAIQTEGPALRAS
ncbi:MAG: hypothetical protein QOE90_3090 [Thermoplasmata archaeon]|jgi:hypothetical protein|nr:hypothetical protein [Thermoplasmata archaeon]